MINNHPRRVGIVHAKDCTCCSRRADRIDIAGASLRFLVGLGWGALIAFSLSVLTGVPVV
ncbi:hypothetical protein CA223_05335 [Sphingomonas koreensis]|uniref:Uncharacterized protein n=1 Tax=Sphingomonas koreensis TaxID=93064 RepID=A0A1L6JBN1_9SPHN|nr:hypothetical protein [Sphingomonas koreensis]APR53339.1 hypothetical protein BRX40_13690 [Sphingomonas koreensis]MDC7809969.1 hypothetical protein [Sphingomonas koreensis]RSU24541.1 hypothetical protein CA224_02145 [Sphingomonas koreensis]RSU25186.1 hypothetical protein CA222_13740 [Sphingomonas koreensis]RSU30139.1 hypothetical protein CA225_05610 [Sphingomonas koreensis]